MKFRSIANVNWSVLAAALLVAFAGVLTGCPDETEEEESYFEVAIDDGASVLDVDEGETVEVTAEVTNTGDVTGIQDIQFEIGDVTDSEEVELDVDDSSDVTFTWETAEGDAGEYTAEVWSSDDADSADVTVEEGEEPGEAVFEVSIDEEASTTEVDLGDNLEIQFELSNTGDAEGTQEITGEAAGAQFQVMDQNQNTEFTLGAGDSQNIVLPVPTGDGEGEIGAGEHTFTLSTEDDSDSVDVTVEDDEDENGEDEDEEFTVSGTVADEADDSELEGVDVTLTDDEDEEVDTATTDENGEFSFDEVEDGEYELTLSAPGLNPDHTVEESDNDNVVSVEVDGDDLTQDLTVSWLSETDLLVDGGLLDFTFDLGDDIDVELPGCEEDNGDWEPVPSDPSDDIDVTYDPEDECFRLTDVGIDLTTGELDVDVADVVFPEITASVDLEEEDEGQAGMIENAEVSLEALIDDVGGVVDFTDGDLDVDMDVRFLIGGEIDTGNGDPIEFGSNDGEDDCQLTGAWGGDVTDPETDNGDYVHDPIEVRLTTGESNGEDGVAYDDGLFTLVDNGATIGRLSEGQYGQEDGFAACGEYENDFDFDFAALINGLLDLPYGEGDFFIEVNFLVP